MKDTVLVTGGTGFLGIHTIIQLLTLGYKVHTTLRSISKKDSIINALKEKGIETEIAGLRFFEADLTSDQNWDEAMKGVTYVLHVASPFRFYDVAQLFKNERPQWAEDIAEMQPTPAEFYKEMSNEKAKTLLGWTPRSKEEALLASADSLMK